MTASPEDDFDYDSVSPITRAFLMVNMAIGTVLVMPILAAYVFRKQLMAFMIVMASIAVWSIPLILWVSGISPVEVTKWLRAGW